LAMSVAMLSFRPLPTAAKLLQSCACDGALISAAKPAAAAVAMQVRTNLDI
jgi:hypothetical protein